ncbi:MAG: hypothetical protein ACTHLO_05540 [Pseudolabrys sp.]
MHLEAPRPRVRAASICRFQDDCCVSPCDPPWLPDKTCLIWYEYRYLRVPYGTETKSGATVRIGEDRYFEFRILFQHRMCLAGKQHGPLLYTVTLLPGEKVTLYHSDRYRQVTSVQDRYSVQTTFMQFLSSVHEARVTNTLSQLSDSLTKVDGSFSTGAGLDIGFLSFGADGSASASSTDHNSVQIGSVSDQFQQSVSQASLLTHAERSVVVSTYSEKDSVDVSARTVQNDNACRAVTYFVRKVMEMYNFSTVVAGIDYRVIAPNVPSDWHSLGDISWLPATIQTQIKNAVKLLPKVGTVVEAPRPFSLPTDGTVYDPELAHCCSCEPQREAAMQITLEKQKADALKACLEAQLLEAELKRRQMLLDQGQLAPFEPAPAPVPASP